MFLRWGVWAGDISNRLTGALVADRAGFATSYALYNLQERGELFVRPFGTHEELQDLSRRSSLGKASHRRFAITSSETATTSKRISNEQNGLSSKP
jgi:hypothetical protein